jgi:hypothetical protein
MHHPLTPAAGSPPTRARRSLPLPQGDPAVAVTGDLRVVDSNRRWRSLHSPFTDLGDIARMVFTDPAAATFFIDRRHEELDAIAILRAALGEEHGRDAARDTVRRLREESPRFERLWNATRVRPRLLDTYAVRHPDLGELTFDRRTAYRNGVLVRVATPRLAAARLLPLLDHLPD